MSCLRLREHKLVVMSSQVLTEEEVLEVGRAQNSGEERVRAKWDEKGVSSGTRCRSVGVSSCSNREPRGFLNSGMTQ